MEKDVKLQLSRTIFSQLNHKIFDPDAAFCLLFFKQQRASGYECNPHIECMVSLNVSNASLQFNRYTHGAYVSARLFYIFRSAKYTVCRFLYLIAFIYSYITIINMLSKVSVLFSVNEQVYTII